MEGGTGVGQPHGSAESLGGSDGETAEEYTSRNTRHKEIRDGSRVPASRAASRDPKSQTPATMTHLISSLDFAILAPVPLVHLESALPTVNAQGQVAFGAAGVRFFEGVESLRGGEPVPLLIYATHTKGNRPGLSVTWRGWYV